MELTELTRRIVAAAEGKALSPADVLDLARRQVHTALWNGETVDILNLLRIQLTESARAGRADGAGAVLTEPLPSLLRPPTPPRKPEIVVVLAVEKSDRFSQITARRLNAPGRRAIVAEGLIGVKQAVDEHGVDVVIMDSELEAGDEIRLWLKSSPARSLISLVVVYRESESVDAVDRFRICEDEYLVEPYEMETLEGVIAGEIARLEEERKYFLHEVSFQFPAKAVYQQQAADLMETLVSHTALSEEGQMGMVVAFREAVDNAARHGCHSQANASVGVAYVLDREKITVTVTDDGPGFDTSRYLETQVSGNAVAVARQRHKEGRQGGLGIMLMLKSVDRLEYNRDGNVAKLTKYIQTGAAVA